MVSSFAGNLEGSQDSVDLHICRQEGEMGGPQATGGQLCPGENQLPRWELQGAYLPRVH